MKTSPLERRLSALEADVAALKTRLELGTGINKENRVPRWKQIGGTFAADPAFDDAMRLGQKYSESSRPKNTGWAREKMIIPRIRGAAGL